MLHRLKEALLIFRLQFTSSELYDSSIIIYGPKTFISKTRKVLQRLKHDESEAYKLLKKSIRHICFVDLQDYAISIHYISQFCKISKDAIDFYDEIYLALLIRAAFQINLYLNSSNETIRLSNKSKAYPWSNSDAINSANFYAYTVLKKLGVSENLLEEFKERTDLIVV